MTRTGMRFVLSVPRPDGRTDEAVLTARQALSFPLVQRAFLAQCGRLIRCPEVEQWGRAGKKIWLDWLQAQLEGAGGEPARPVIPVEVMAQRSLN